MKDFYSVTKRSILNVAVFNIGLLVAFMVFGLSMPDSIKDRSIVGQITVLIVVLSLALSTIAISISLGKVVNGYRYKIERSGNKNLWAAYNVATGAIKRQVIYTGVFITLTLILYISFLIDYWGLTTPASILIVAMPIAGLTSCFFAWIKVHSCAKHDQENLEPK